MELKQKYLKCFTLEKSEQLKILGYIYLYEQNGVYYHQNNESLFVKYGNTDVLKDTKYSLTINF